MTESYDPYANAVAERVNGILKQEFLLEEYKTNLQTMRIIVKEAIEVYNKERPHMSCQLLTTNQMHKQRQVKMRTYKKIIREELASHGL